MRSSLFAFLLVVSVAVPSRAQAPGAASEETKGKYPPVVHLTNAEDHQRVMDQLGMKTIRPGRDGSHPDAPNYANFDESKATLFGPIPDPLLLSDGKRVTTARQWWNERRPQIVELFDREIYGRTPTHTPAVRWEVTSTKEARVGTFPVVTKALTGHVENSAYPLITVDIKMELTTPANASGPVPIILEFGFLGPFPTRPGFTPPPPPPGPSWQEQLLAKGWGYAVLAPNSVQADNGAGLTEGIIGLCNHGQPRKLDDWGVLKAWAWGASRALDYFATDKAVDAKQVGITGHSRYGKAALVAMAYDQRFAIGYISSSGEAGAKLFRRNYGESVENIADPNAYHWMAGNYVKYAGMLTPADLPVDSDELIALCAPRPVFISGGKKESGDGWVDAKGMFLAAAAAGPVYKLLGKRDLGTNEFPAIETPLISGDIAFRQHSGGHTPGPNWPTFIEFASRYLKGPGRGPVSLVGE